MQWPSYNRLGVSHTVVTKGSLMIMGSHVLSSSTSDSMSCTSTTTKNLEHVLVSISLIWSWICHVCLHEGLELWGRDFHAQVDSLGYCLSLFVTNSSIRVTVLVNNTSNKVRYCVIQIIVKCIINSSQPSEMTHKPTSTFPLAFLVCYDSTMPSV